MNRALGHLCAHTGHIGPGEPPEDGKMSEINQSIKTELRGAHLLSVIMCHNLDQSRFVNRHPAAEGLGWKAR